MAFDTSIHNQLRSDFRKMEGELHEMIENVHNFEDEVSEELEEAQEMEQLLSHALQEIEQLEERNLALMQLEQKAGSKEGLKEKEKDMARDMFSELHQLAKDIDTARAVISDLKNKDNEARESITKISEIEEVLINGQQKLLEDEDGMLRRLEEIHPDYDGEINMDWITELEHKYKDSS